MKIKIIGSIIGIIQFIIMLFIIVNVYKGSFRSVSMFILLLIIFQAAFYNRLLSKNRKVLIQKIVIINIFLIIVTFALLPKYTYTEAKIIAEDKYKNELDYFVEFEPYYNNTIPVRADGIEEIFIPSRFYYFSFVRINGEKKHIMINPLKGKIVELEDSYWKE
ncbi:hypothetical protein [Clostridium sp.]|uniref:hypothetical protein n=1 Tax=Clostridium sp. TaxID=1506 RepID=UPI003D6D1D67